MLGWEGQSYGPFTILELDEFIEGGRIVPTTLLNPEGTQMRIAASTVAELNWGESETFTEYTIQEIRGFQNEVRGSIVCLVSNLALCCMPRGFHLLAGIVGVYLAYRAIRMGSRTSWALLILNGMVLLVTIVTLLSPMPGVEQVVKQYQSIFNLGKRLR